MRLGFCLFNHGKLAGAHVNCWYLLFIGTFYLVAILLVLSDIGGGLYILEAKVNDEKVFLAYIAVSSEYLFFPDELLDAIINNTSENMLFINRLKDSVLEYAGDNGKGITIFIYSVSSEDYIVNKNPDQWIISETTAYLAIGDKEQAMIRIVDIFLPCLFIFFLIVIASAILSMSSHTLKSNGKEYVFEAFISSLVFVIMVPVVVYFNVGDVSKALLYSIGLLLLLLTYVVRNIKQAFSQTQSPSLGICNAPDMLSLCLYSFVLFSFSFISLFMYFNTQERILFIDWSRDIAQTLDITMAVLVVLPILILQLDRNQRVKLVLVYWYFINIASIVFLVLWLLWPERIYLATYLSSLKPSIINTLYIMFRIAVDIFALIAVAGNFHILISNNKKS